MPVENYAQNCDKLTLVIVISFMICKIKQLLL